VLLFLSFLSIEPITQGQKENFLIYENSLYGIRIQYPSDWIKTEENRFISFKPPDGGHASLVALQYSNLSVTNMTLSMIVKKDVDTLKHYFKNFSLHESTVNDTESKHSYSIIYTYKNRYSPVEFKSMQVWSNNNNNNNKIYLMTYVSQAEQFDRYLPIVKYMINSFTIIK
jgi:hypothetical protein